MIRIESADPERDPLIGTSVTSTTDGLSARSVFAASAERTGGGEQRLPGPMRWLAVAALWAAAVSAAFAAPVLVPGDLAPGDAYRLVFVTSGTILPTSTDIADYNAFVDPFGETLIPEHDWRAIVSTAAVDARDNTATVPGTDDPGGIPVYRLDGIRVANSYAALWNSAFVPLLAAVRLTEAAVDSPFIGGWVWTGTTSTGVAGGALPGFPSTIGNPGATNTEWMIGANVNPFDSLPLYAISGVLTVPNTMVPLPSALGLFALAFGLLTRRRLR